MENPESSKAASAKKAKPTTESLRVKRETKKKVLSEVAILNKKDFGRRITPDEYVSLAISRIRPEDLQSLKEQSLSNKDRLEQRYVDYCAEHGKVSKDEFIGMLLSARK